MFVAATAGASAQGRWEYEAVTAAEFETYNPQVAYDRWGNTHLMFSSRDPRRSGLQLFYTTNASGRFSAPIQVTDTGTVFDSSNAELSSFQFRLDATGVAHVAFVANVENHLRLYYTSNVNGHFEPARFLAERQRYGMAVDSAGRAHVVWAEEATGAITLRYWSTVEPDAEYDAGVLPCNEWRYGCRVGDIEVEAGMRGVVAAIASDSASIHIFPVTLPGSRQRVPIIGYDQNRTMMGQADLRFRMALDAEGAIHLLAPRSRFDGRHYLLYASNAGGTFTSSVLTDTLPSQTKEFSFDLSFNGRDRIVAMWSSSSTSMPVRLGMTEITSSGRVWSIQPALHDIDPRLTSGRAIWKRGLRVAVRGDQVVIAALSRPDVDREEIVALISRTGLRPVVSYLHPDAAAPEMSVVVDAIAPYREKGSFGADGFHGDTVALELRNPLDSARVVVGPSVVSWDGRLVSTMLFVKRGATPGPIPLAVRIGLGSTAKRSNLDTFFIVAPQRVGDAAGVLNGGGVLGSGGIYGERSRRGVLVVDSLILRSGTWRVDTSDTDPSTPGNQGYLPVTILSRGRVVIDSGATLTVSAEHDLESGRYGVAGPGGGGGGTGGWRVPGGTGFTGGAGPSRYGDGPIGASVGSGTMNRSSRYGGGASLNGTPGGLVFLDVPGGGGTGHPFGASGVGGRASDREPVRLDEGGYGGATGGSQALAFDGPTTGGGGGGHGVQGQSGNNVNEAINGGAVVGSRPLVPLAGGSGGGGGGYSTNGIASGGGGGGALAIFGFSDVIIAGSITADGAPGIGDIPMTNSSGGGGGAGGGVLVGAKGRVLLERAGSISARGGGGGVGHPAGGRNGGRGGDGRIRLDGRAIGAVAARTVPRAAYSGPSTGTNGSAVARMGDTLIGSGEPGRKIRLFIRSESGRWNYGAPYEVTVRPDSTWRLQLGPDASGGRLYIATMQGAVNPTRTGHTAEPDWVMSSAGGNILGQPVLAVSRRNHRFGCIKYTDSDTTTIEISNQGVLSDLEIHDISIAGPGGAAFASDYRGARIAPGESMPLRVVFTPSDTGAFRATLTIETNAIPDAIATVALEACAVAGTLVAQPDTIDLGALCIGDTVVRSVTLSNVGDAPVVLDEVRGDEGELDVEPLVPVDGTVIEQGTSLTLPMRMIVRRFGGELEVRIESDALPRTLELPVRARDARPQASLDRSRLVFRTLDISAGDTCERQTVWIRNASPLDSLVIAQATVLPSEPFRLITPLEGVVIPPSDSIAVELAFCTSVAGEHGALLSLTLGRGQCAAGAMLSITGAASIGAADLALVHPPDSTIELYQTLVGATSPRDSIVIVNDGTVEARLAVPRIVAGEATVDGEFAVEESVARTIAPGERMVYHVTFSPQSAGRKQADLLVDAEDGSWTAKVRLLGTGIVPGVGLNLSELRFGDVRVGDTRSLTLEIFNSGTAPDVIRSITPEPGAPFELILDRTLPFSIDSGQVVRAEVRYAPTVERGDTLQLAIAVGSQSEPIPLTLSGRGVLEHAVAIDDTVSFGPVRRNTVFSKPQAFSLRNTGTHDLTINGYDFVQEDSLFFWGEIPTLPIVIEPGSERVFSLGYFAARGDTASIVFTTSSPESPVTVRLYGFLEDEADTVTLIARSGSGYVGDHEMIAIDASFSEPTPHDVRYTVTMRYASGLLAPRDLVAGRSMPASALAGSMSSSATVDAVAPGEVAISGIVRGGSRSGRLFSVPMLVLAGPPARTSLELDGASFVITPAYVVRTTPGEYIGIDCDTGRGLVSKGVYELTQNAPNPTAPHTVIEYSVADREHVRINLYDPSGFFVRALVDEVKDPGRYRLVLDVSTIGSGIFTYEMISGPFRDVKRMVVVE